MIDQTGRQAGRNAGRSHAKKSKRSFLTGARSSAPARHQAFPEDMELLVLEDVDNGNEFYLALVDSFTVSGREYVAMSSYEPDDGTHRPPEFVIMRYAEGPGGEQYYQSIRRKKELDLAFQVFFERYIEHF